MNSESKPKRVRQRSATQERYLRSLAITRVTEAIACAREKRLYEADVAGHDTFRQRVKYTLDNERRRLENAPTEANLKRLVAAKEAYDDFVAQHPPRPNFLAEEKAMTSAVLACGIYFNIPGPEGPLPQVSVAVRVINGFPVKRCPRCKKTAKADLKTRRYTCPCGWSHHMPSL